MGLVVAINLTGIVRMKARLSAEKHLEIVCVKFKTCS